MRGDRERNVMTCLIFSLDDSLAVKEQFHPSQATILTVRAKSA